MKLLAILTIAVLVYTSVGLNVNALPAVYDGPTYELSKYIPRELRNKFSKFKQFDSEAVSDKRSYNCNLISNNFHFIKDLFAEILSSGLYFLSIIILWMPARWILYIAHTFAENGTRNATILCNRVINVQNALPFISRCIIVVENTHIFSLSSFSSPLSDTARYTLLAYIDNTLSIPFILSSIRPFLVTSHSIITSLLHRFQILN